MILANSGVIALEEKPWPKPDRSTSTEPKKKSLFLRIGPPMVAFASLRRNTGTCGWKIEFRPVSRLLV